MINIFSLLRPLDLKRVLAIMIVTYLVSGGIEWLQMKVGRSASWDDVKLSVAGSLAVIMIYVLDLSKKKIIVYANIFLIISACVVLSWPTLKVFIDELYILKQSPVLSDFSTPLERTRWRGSFSKIALINEDGRKSLLTTLKPGHWFSTVELRHFYKDWSGYNQLVIEVEYLETDSFKASIRIHDKQHRQSWYAFEDRFTKSFTLLPGINILQFELDTIKNAPFDRSMDMSNIEAVMLVARKFEKERRLKVNKVYLQ